MRPGSDPEPVPPRPVHAWTGWVYGWHGAFWALAGLSVVMILVTEEMSPRQRVFGLAIVGALMASYGVLVPPRTWRVDRRTHAYLAIAVPLIGCASSVNSSLLMLLFLVYPQAWMLSSSLATGLAFTIAFTVSTMVGAFARSGLSWTSAREIVPPMTAGLLFSVLLGFWISRIIQQSQGRAELIAELEAARSELARAERARGVMAERERMAREIHDTLAQGFTSIVMLAQTASAVLERRPERVADRLAVIEDVARQNLAEARALVAAFSPVDLDGATLTAALRRLTERFAAETGLAVDLRIDDDVARLGRDQEVVLLRAVQESLANVRRHAAARHVVVRLVVDARSARVEVGDDGVGFAPGEQGGEPAGGFGLSGMRGRVTEAGGELDVASAPGAGTRVTVTLPVAARAGEEER